MSSNQENIGIPLRCIPHFIGINPKAFRDIFDPLKNNQSTPTIYEAAKTTSNIVDSKSVNDLFNKLNAKKTDKDIIRTLPKDSFIWKDDLDKFLDAFRDIGIHTDGDPYQYPYINIDIKDFPYTDLLTQCKHIFNLTPENSMSRRQIGINKTQIRDKKIRQLAETFKGKNLNLNNNKSSLAKVLKNANEKPYYMDNAEFEKMKSLSVRALRGILK